MKKHVLILLMVMLGASAAPAQQAAEPKGAAPQAEVFQGLIGPSYNWVSQEGNTRADEYNFLESSGGGDLRFDYVPLPHRFSIDTHYLNQKDFIGELDYAYRDVVLVNFLTRGVYHNLDHFAIGPDDPATVSPSFTDLNPSDLYAVENQIRKGFIRFKTPDFPFHIYADALAVDRKGDIQQRFLRGFTGGLNVVSQTRPIDWNSQEVRVGTNSHFGPVEFDYNHTERKFKSLEDKVLFDVYPLFAAPHNLVPNLTSSSDTIKLHTSFTGRVTASVTYTDGDRKNQDSDVKAGFKNAAGDLSLTPVAGLFLVLKYRHYDLSLDNPETVTIPSLGTTYNVRTPISSQKDVMVGQVRYRFTRRLSVRGEYAVESTDREVLRGTVLTPLQIAPIPSGSGPNDWDVAQHTAKSTEKLGVTYQVMNKLSLRADYSASQVTNPAYANDPDSIDSAKAMVTWMPVQQFIALASYGGVREKRSNLAAPLAGGSRKTDRDQALGSFTILPGKGSSITASYMYFRNKTKETLTFTDASGIFILDDSVPYGDTSDVVSLAASAAVAQGVMLTADASRSFSRGSFRLDGSVPNTGGIDVLSDTRVIEDIYTAGLEIKFSRYAGTDIRYQYRQYNDTINNAQDGRVNKALAMVYMKW